MSISKSKTSSFIAQSEIRAITISAYPESEINYGPGSKKSIFFRGDTLLNPGDEVILFEPYYGYLINTILAAEAVPTYVGLKAPDWTLSMRRGKGWVN